MLLPLYLYTCWEIVVCLCLYFCWEGVLNIWIVCSIHVTLYLCLERVKLNIWRSSVRSTLLCIFVGFCVWSLLRERESASDQIYEGRVFDQRSTQLALHNSTSNHVGGEQWPRASARWIAINKISNLLAFWKGKYKYKYALFGYLLKDVFYQI